MVKISQILFLQFLKTHFCFILKIRLFTPEGHLKYETDCAPNNGYYMIPVYSKGTYLLRVDPPAGWEFGKQKKL